MESVWIRAFQIGYSLRKNFWIDDFRARSHIAPAFNATVLASLALLRWDAAGALVCRWFDTDIPAVGSLVTAAAS